MAQKKNYYTLLGLTENDKKLNGEAFNSLLKKKYRKLSLKHHPDKQIGKSPGDIKKAEDLFKEINEAQSVLSDPDKKRAYDMFGEDGLMESGFGNRQQRRKPMFRGRDVSITINLTLKEFYSGTHKKMKLKCEVICSDCNGSGSAKNESPITCQHCHGTGIITQEVNYGGMSGYTQTTCRYCGGTGEIITTPCTSCSGSGIKIGDKEVDIDIPYGIPNNIRLSMEGYGGAPYRGNGINGDLHINVKEIKDSKYERIDNDIHQTINTPIIGLMLGDIDIEEATIDDTKIKFKIPKGSENGKKIKLSGKGMSIYNSRRRGDLIVTINYAIPKKLTDEQISLLEKFNAIETGK